MTPEPTHSFSAIVAQEQALLAAMQSADLEALNALLHEDLRFMLPNGQSITKSMDLETYASGGMKISSLVASNLEIQILGDSAVVTVNLAMKGQFFEQALDGDYAVLRVWKLSGEQWKVIAGSSIGC